MTITCPRTMDLAVIVCDSQLDFSEAPAVVH